MSRRRRMHPSHTPRRSLHPASPIPAPKPTNRTFCKPFPPSGVYTLLEEEEEEGRMLMGIARQPVGGPLASLDAALADAPPGSWVLLASCDLAGVTAALVQPPLQHRDAHWSISAGGCTLLPSCATCFSGRALRPSEPLSPSSGRIVFARSLPTGRAASARLRPANRFPSSVRGFDKPIP
jgi:hypothetical protein